MASKDPNFEFSTMPERVVDSVDYNLFYKPDRQNVSQGLVQLSKSLQSLVPSLTNYAITEDIKDKEKEEARAMEDFFKNKKAFAQLVKNGEIPEGANPYYFNKMMSLDLTQKARKFKAEFQDYEINNTLSQSLDGDAWNEAYETQIKAFYEKEGLDRYDPVALSNSFFNVTSSFRDEREQQHNAARMSFIKKQTEDGQIKNYQGMFIEAQSDGLDTSALFTKIKDETKSMMDLGVSGQKSNDLFLVGFKRYLNSINDADGYDYARQVLDDMPNLKLGTGYFTGKEGKNRNAAIVAELRNELNAKELAFLEGQKKRFTVEEDIKKQELGQAFFVEYNKADFDLSKFLDETVETENGNTINRFSNKDKAYIQGLKIALDKTLQVTTSSIDALEILTNLEETNPYLVKQKALELSRDGQLSNADFKFYFNSTNRKQISKKNEFFILSTPYQQYQKMFSSQEITSIPGFKLESALLRNKFEEDMIAWHKENVNDVKFEGKPYEYQKAFNGQVKLLMGDILADSLFIQSVYDTIGKDISKTFGIFIEDRRQ